MELLTKQLHEGIWVQHSLVTFVPEDVISETFDYIIRCKGKRYRINIDNFEQTNTCKIYETVYFQNREVGFPILQSITNPPHNNILKNHNGCIVWSKY